MQNIARNYYILLALAIPLILSACNLLENPPINQGDMWACHHTTSWDSLQTNNALIGEWDWEFISCFWTPQDANSRDFRGLSVLFKPDSTLQVKDKGRLR